LPKSPNLLLLKMRSMILWKQFKGTVSQDFCSLFFPWNVPPGPLINLHIFLFVLGLNFVDIFLIFRELLYIYSGESDLTSASWSNEVYLRIIYLRQFETKFECLIRGLAESF
jgi:hypothetical protein